MKILTIAGMRCNIKVIEVLLSLGFTFPKVESNLKAFIKDFLPPAAASLAKLGLVAADISVSPFGVPPIFTATLSPMCDDTLKRYFSKREIEKKEEDKIRMALKNIESVEVNLGWLGIREIEYGEKDKKFFDNLGDLLKDKLKIFKKEFKSFTEDAKKVLSSECGDNLMSANNKLQENLDKILRNCKNLRTKTLAKKKLECSKNFFTKLLTKKRDRQYNNLVNPIEITERDIGRDVENYNKQLDVAMKCYKEAENNLAEANRNKDEDDLFKQIESKIKETLSKLEELESNFSWKVHLES
ncbi:MAG TPA: hypothetical protein DEP20_01745 [Fusobacteria bacterium]|nr:hypothetical protein [Fusobacteriota bacterium]|tara:strand:+ start:896 stop:1792 length:897 start_codon:yes stop_codon:yes gene_type:complete